MVQTINVPTSVLPQFDAKTIDINCRSEQLNDIQTMIATAQLLVPNAPAGECIIYRTGYMKWDKARAQISVFEDGR